MSICIIPVNSSPNHSMRVVIPVDGKNLTLNLTFRYNSVGAFWAMTIANKNNVVVLDSIPLLTGQYPAADILSPHRRLRLGSACIVSTGRPNITMDSPDSSNLGTTYCLGWGDTVQ